MKTTILVDGDIVLYKAATKAELPVNWGDDFWSLTSDLKLAKQLVEADIEDTASLLGATHIVVCLSCPSSETFRAEIYPNYKTNRKDTRKPMGLEVLRQFCRDTWFTQEGPKLEADDILGILSTKQSEERRVICSIDKDMRTIPGWLYSGLEKGLEEITPLSARQYHMKQTLCGDSTDNYPGCPGVGPKTADKILKGLSEPIELWEAVVKAFANKQLSEDRALLMARLAYILQSSNYSNNTIKLWKAPK